MEFKRLIYNNPFLYHIAFTYLLYLHMLFIQKVGTPVFKSTHLLLSASFTSFRCINVSLVFSAVMPDRLVFE